MSDWIKLHRQFRESPYYTNSSAVHVWLECLLRASHAPREMFFRRGRITLQPGQFVMGRDEFSKSIGMSPSTAWYWLLQFESDSMVDIKKTAKGSIVSLKNWTTYQGVDSTLDIKKTANKQQKDTNKKVKNDKNHESTESDASTPSGEFCATAQTTETPRMYADRFFAKETAAWLAERDFFAERGAPVDFLRDQFARFWHYWSELTPGGKKQRWQTEKTFEVRRRLVTWIDRAGKDMQRKGGSLTMPDFRSKPI